MKFLSFFLLLALNLPTDIIAGGNTSITNEHVDFTATLKKNRLAGGSTGVLFFTLKPHKGIHVNLEPPIGIRMENDSLATLTGDLELSSLKKDTTKYLDASKPISQKFMLSKLAGTGTKIVKGTLTYFYCSDAEGWCSRFRQPFEVTLTVVH